MSVTRDHLLRAARQMDAPSPPESSLGLAICASFTAQPLLAGLRFWFEELDIRAQVDSAPYGQVLQSLLDPLSVLNVRHRGLNVALLRVADWLRELPDTSVTSPAFLEGYLAEAVRDLERAVRAHRAQASADTLLLLCPWPSTPDARVTALLDRAEHGIRAAVQDLPGLDVVVARDMHARYAVDETAIHDPVRERIAHLPYRDAYFHVLATITMRHAHRRIVASRKVVVVDCDNTLWRGVVGEVGPGGVTFEPEHLALHDTLNHLSESGVLVCLCSKNEESDVWSVFDTRSDLRLSRDRIVAGMIDWRRKSDNLRQLAARLSLGLDSFVFIDDSPLECAEVRASCPEVLTLQWPTESQAAMRLLDHAWELDFAKRTREDERRTQMYREEFRRQELREETLTFAEFLLSLELAVDVRSLAPEDVKRAAQLTLRTNQFNFTTRRRDETELVAMHAAGTHDIRTIRVRDRFGDYGLVGLTILDVSCQPAELDTFLLSCRVLGRGVEHRMLAEVGRCAEERGIGAIRMHVEPTRRNAPAQVFLRDVAPPNLLRRLDSGTLACEWAAQDLARLVFEPSARASGVAGEAGQIETPPTPHGYELVRVRERQIARTAASLSTMTQLEAALGGGSPRSTSPAEGADTTAIVYAAFAAVLGLPVDRVKELDRLEALGCDSFKIVEITVALLERFPTLPATLLFEHRSVKEIAAQVAALSSEPAAPSAMDAVAVPALATATLPPAASTTDVAVVGMNVLCAGATSPGELWQLLSAGRVAVDRVLSDRSHFLRGLHDTRPHWAGLLQDVDLFDAEFFGISPREAELMDPQLRLFLQVAWGALEDAGCAGDAREEDTGVFVGSMYFDYGPPANEIAQATSQANKCWEAFSLANRLSQILRFRGPSLSVDTACSSSGTALHLACRALAAGDCRAAVVGGVNLILDGNRFAQLGRLGILSPTGRCLAFGAEADGTVLGEGVGVVVLKTLPDALVAGDRIYGVIKGSAATTGNGTVGFTAPNPVAQAEAVRRSLRFARVDPRTISYVETHGTGTSLGDPIEVRGLTLAFADPSLRDEDLRGEHRCRLGSIKPNIGHLEAGAGVLGLIKVLLQMQHGMLVPSITSEHPNPQIPFADTPFAVQRRLEPWPRPVLSRRGVPVTISRRAGLSSFGVGGANVHVIVEESPTADESATVGPERAAHVLALSARSDDSLRQQAANLANWIEQHGEVSLGDVCFSANSGRQHFERRLALVLGDGSEAIEKLRQVAAGPSVVGPSGNVPRSAAPRKVGFLFSGQGSQFPGMGRALYDSQPVFRDALDRCAVILDRLLDEPLLPLMFGSPDSPGAERLHQTGYTQPALFALEYAVAELWASWGVHPDFVLGHSVGEIAALVVAGGMSLEDGARLVAARGQLMQALPAGGAMVSIMASEPCVREALAGFEDRVAIAAINGPAHVVISGEASAVEAIGAGFSNRAVKTKPLTVSHAFHSPLMKPMAAAYARVVDDIMFTTPRVPFVSGVLGTVVNDELTSSAYWVRQVLDPVRFADGMTELERQGVGVFLEVGPQPVLLGMGRQCVSAADAQQWLPSLRKDGETWRTLLGSVAQLHVSGVPVNWKRFDQPYARRRVTLPSYAFTRKRFWITPISQPSIARTVAVASSQQTASGPRAYEVVWRHRPVPVNPAETASSGTWIVLQDRGSVARDLGRSLERLGASCVLVSAAGTDLAALWPDIRARHGDIRGVLHLAALDVRPDQSNAAHALVSSAAHLVRAARQAPGGSPPLWFVTRGAVWTGVERPADGPLSLAQSGLWGFARTVALEHPDTWGGIVDLAPDQPVDLDALARTVLQAGDEDQLALRDSGQYVPRLVPCALPANGLSSLRADGCYLVTGGLGALGLAVAKWLVARGARHLVLASRRGLDTPGADAAVRALRSAGATVRVVSADVSRGDGVDRALAAAAEDGAALRGVIHAAGTDVTIPVQDLTETDVRAVLAPKIDGGWLLHTRTRQVPLDLFVCFSSMASVLGAAKRAHYAAANAFLDTLAHERRRLGLAAHTINWGPWAGGGMASPDSLRQFAQIGNRGVEPDAALAALDRILAGTTAQVSVFDVEWPRFRSVYEARRRRPLLAEIQDGSRPVPADATRRSHAVASAQGERVSEDDVLELLRAEVASTLGYGSPADFRVDQNFTDLGLDSLMAAELASRIETRLGIGCSGAVFDHPSVEALAAHLNSRRAMHQPGSMAASPAPAVTAEGQGRWIETLRATSADERLEALTALLREEVARTLGFAAAAEVRLDCSFTEMGMDSLLAAEFAAHLRAQLGVEDPGSVFDHPFVPALASHLLVVVGNGASTPSPSSAAEASGMVRFTPALTREVIEFQKTAFPSRRQDWIEARWRWMFLESASRLDVAPQVWLFADQGRIVAHNGAIPVRLKTGPGERVTSWFVDTMVLEEWRGRAVGSRLMMHVHEDHPFALSLGQTVQMRQILLHLGWQQVAPLQFAQLLIRPDRVLKGKLPTPAALAVTFGLRASTAIRRRRDRESFGEIRELTRFESRHDDLWQTAAQDVTCAIVRDASYLNWKYVSQPGQEFVRLELVENGRAAGVIVLMVREPDANYRYRRAFIVDLVAPLSDPRLLGALIAGARVAASAREADALICLHVNARLTEALRRAGFRLRQPTRFFLVRPGQLNAAERDMLLTADHWFITHGDSDVDRP